jgi:hypothetical protein
MSLVQLARDRVTARSRHIHIGDHHVRPEQAAEVKRLIPAQHDLDLMSLVAKYQREHVRGVAIVIGDQDAQRLRRGGCAAGRHYTKWRFAGQDASYAMARGDDSQRIAYNRRTTDTVVPEREVSVKP